MIPLTSYKVRVLIVIMIVTIIVITIKLLTIIVITMKLLTIIVYYY